MPSSLPPPNDPGLPLPTSTSSLWHSPPHAFLHAHRTTPSLPASIHTIIIGSGIAGTLLYHHLSPAPHTTLMLEARNTCWGATGRNGGHCKPMLYQSSQFISISATHGAAEAIKRVRFELLNLDLIRSVAAQAGECEWADSDSADVFFEAEAWEEARRNIAELEREAPELAALLRIVTAPKELRELRTPGAVGAVVFRAARLAPYKLVTGLLARGVRERGLNLQTTTPAMGVRRGKRGGWVVETPRGTVEAARVVFATNAHTAHLLPAMRGWIYPVRAQMAALVPPRSLRTRPLNHTYGLVRRSRKTAWYLIQRPFEADGSGGELMLGGGRELEEAQGVGLQDGGINVVVAKALRSSIPGYFADETGYEGDLGEESGREQLRRSFIEKFRGLRLGGGGGHDVWDAAEGLGIGDEEAGGGGGGGKGRNIKGRECRARMEWSGTMGFSKDGRPFVGRVPAVGTEDAKRLGVGEMCDTDGLWMLAGFEGHGEYSCTWTRSGQLMLRVRNGVYGGVGEGAR